MAVPFTAWVVLDISVDKPAVFNPIFLEMVQNFAYSTITRHFLIEINIFQVTSSALS